MVSSMAIIEWPSRPLGVGCTEETAGWIHVCRFMSKMCTSL